MQTFLDKKIIYLYRIRVNTTPAAYKKIGVFGWWLIEMRWKFVQFLIKKAPKSGLLGKKEATYLNFNLVLVAVNQEWRCIDADMVIKYFTESKEPSRGPTENYSLENAITKPIAEINTGVTWSLLSNCLLCWIEYVAQVRWLISQILLNCIIVYMVLDLFQ